MAVVQMNVRIDEDVKARGDEIFARAGLTSSEVVRAVWELAVEAGEAPGFLRTSSADIDEAEQQRKVALVEEGAHLWDKFLLDHRLPASKQRTLTCSDLAEKVYFGKPKEELTEDELRLAYYQDLRYEAYEEKFTERETT